MSENIFREAWGLFHEDFVLSYFCIFWFGLVLGFTVDAHLNIPGEFAGEDKEKIRRKIPIKIISLFAFQRNLDIFYQFLLMI